uniref:Reverse transcriptase Ty1/copia-type domain-containing protein n=1 Tax=Ustilago esculenta TaxID=185366 RepID=A0A481SHV2_9BASI|nr:hypothetical protein UE_1370 [Ustilago esculenta]
MSLRQHFNTFILFKLLFNAKYHPYSNPTKEQSFAIRDANGKIRPVTIVKDKIDKKVEYDNIVDQLQAEENKLGLHVYGLGQQSRNSVSAFAFKLLDLWTKAILSSRNATFDQELFPFKGQDIPQIEETTTINIHDEAPQEPVIIHPTPIQAISPDIMHPPSNIGPTFAQEEEGVGFPYLTQEERDQGISTPPLEDYIHSLSSVAIDDTKGTFTDEAKAIQKELNSHQENNTWTVVDAPNNANIICCQWVFKVKWKGDGTIDKYKARLVAQGYTQVHGFDYKETFTPVVKMATLRMLMIMSLQYDMKIYQLDVITAYLNGELDVNLYMRQPPLPASMMQLGSQSLVCKLNKSLYGLKQAGCTWYQKADSTLTDIGFKQSNYDSTLYYIENKGEPPLILTLYVDDVLIFAKHKPTADKFISTLQSKFKMTGGDPFGLDNTNIVHTPAIASDIANGVALNANDHSLYYIAFAVNHLSCYLASPTDKAMTAAKHLLHYLKGTASYRPLFTKKGTAFPPEED